MGNVSFGMEFIFLIYAEFNFAVMNRFDNSGNASQEIVLNFFCFNTFIEALVDFPQTVNKSPFGPVGNFVTHQDTNVVNGLPCLV